MSAIFRALRSACATMAALALGAATPAAFAQAYPTKPIRIVVPFPAGGSTDAVARLVGTRLYDAWGQTVVVDNKPGAGGIIGNDAVAKAAPDGYTLLLGITALVQAPSLYARLPYDVSKDLTGVAQIALSQDLFVVHPGVPAATLKEFVALAKASPGRYSVGSYGNGTSSHIHAEMLKQQAGIELVHVPYKGGAPQLTDLLAGQIQSAFLDVANARAQLASGKFKVLAVSGERRSKLAPDAPTFTELGYKDFEPYGFFGLFVPAGTPGEIVSKLSSELTRIVRAPDVAARIEELGLQPSGLGAAEFAPLLVRDREMWKRTIQAGQVRIE
ncbi:MAG TPA: tripartite tricarboxylate transporter substrate binding protein [Burkholderiaceae bacterium]